MELTDEERANIQTNMAHNRGCADDNPSKDVNPSEEEWNAVLDAAVAYASEHDAKTIRSKQLRDRLDLDQSIVGAILHQQAQETDVIEETPFKPNGGRRFRVYPEEANE